MSHSEKYWKDSERFLPERFLPESFAYLEMSILLAKLIWKYEFELVDRNLEWDKLARNWFLWVKPDLYVRFRERKREEEQG
ncbi:hypothetical protein QBC38DRAFT_462089 [Podospora fimiseda]|uniref:Uncharacterized protein n=1 Tax=Podospora fimiseda TaxID=252190 RepID=A0AAN6YMT8_9PEZI|nr:hypothetical protein QBC38DRAFT_462089 [Podospora fimiseda]